MLLVLCIGCDTKDAAPGTSAGGSAGGAAPASTGPRRIAVIPRGTTQVFWKSVEAGARQAVGEAGAMEMVWKPGRDGDRDQQVQLVQQSVEEGVAGIILAPLDDDALKAPVAAAMAKNIPVVLIDSDMKGTPGTDFTSSVVIDHDKAGTTAGRELGRLLDGKGKVVMLRHQEGSAGTTTREAAFLRAMTQFPKIEVIVQDRYGGATADSAKAEAARVIDRLKEADGVFTPSESTTLGMLLALQEGNLAGQKKFVGFGTAPPLLEALKADQIHALLARHAFLMGHESVGVLRQKFAGQSPNRRVDLDAIPITNKNVDDPGLDPVLGR